MRGGIRDGCRLSLKCTGSLGDSGASQLLQAGPTLSVAAWGAQGASQPSPTEAPLCIIHCCGVSPSFVPAAAPQNKLALALREYRLLHAGQARGGLPHNKLIFPPTLRYLPIWVLGAPPGPAAKPPCTGSPACTRPRPHPTAIFTAPKSPFACLLGHVRLTSLRRACVRRAWAARLHDMSPHVR